MSITTFKRCPTCGQVVRGKLPDDPLSDAVLHILEHSNGHYIKARVIQDMVGMDVSQPTLWRRLNALEREGAIERHPEHPKSGWRKTRQKADTMAA
jgi:DNA-binding HxlR family transcriptional regulator